MKQGLKQTVKALVVMCFFGGLSMAMGQDKLAKPRVVIVCGEDWKGHIWQETAPRLRQIINSKNEYDVRIVEDITFMGTDRLASYDVLVMHFKNYNPLPNDAQARANVQAFVENGGGLVAIHWSTGLILDTLRDLEIERNTLVIFTSDNGGTFRSHSSNAPLRGQKGEVWEGGMRVCTLMQWPGVIPAGTDRHELTTTMDLLPTIAEVIGQELPKDRLIDGRNIWPLIAGQPEAKTPHDAFYYYWMNHLSAVRSGKWKLHVSYIKRDGTGMIQKRVTELYDLENDIGETTNIAADHPEVVKRLMELIKEARIDLGDGPYLGRNTRPAGYVESAQLLTNKDYD
jgi:hypothetical protein